MKPRDGEYKRSMVVAAVIGAMLSMAMLLMGTSGCATTGLVDYGDPELNALMGGLEHFGATWYLKKNEPAADRIQDSIDSANTWLAFAYPNADFEFLDLANRRLDDLIETIENPWLRNLAVYIAQTIVLTPDGPIIDQAAAVGVAEMIQMAPEYAPDGFDVTLDVRPEIGIDQHGLWTVTGWHENPSR